MDILIHTCSGLATATVVAAAIKTSARRKIAILLTGAFAGALPDIDVISRWSGFDGTFGEWFGLAHSGREIFGAKFWYSHHNFTHSILCDLLVSILFVLALVLIFKKLRNRQPNGWKIFSLTFFLAYFSHLLGDLPTPGGRWDGINLFFPSTNFVGGFGHTWWWNNYDIFLIILSVVAINLILIMLSSKLKFPAFKIALATYVLGFCLIVNQFHTRGQNFNYKAKTGQFGSFEQISLDIQREVLGEKLFTLMVKFDRLLPFYF